MISLISMKLLCLLLWVSCISCYYIGNDTSSKDKIFGGEVTAITDRPYQASLIYNHVHEYGATIIAASWLVSGAHCVAAKEDILSNGLIRTGSVFKDDGGDIFSLETVIVHFQYDPVLQENDIVLLKVNESIPFHSHQIAIALNSDPLIPAPDHVIIISGYGKEDSRDTILSPVLKEATVKVLIPETCNIAYVRRPMTESVFCADSVPADACDGDSGGPAIFLGKIVGIITTWYNCGNPLYPTIYTRISHHYHWIREKTGLDL